MSKVKAYSNTSMTSRTMVNCVKSKTRASASCMLGSILSSISNLPLSQSCALLRLKFSMAFRKR